MKKITILLIVLYLNHNIFGEEGVIDLSNISSNTSKDSEIIDRSRDFDDLGNGKFVLPKGFHIRKLGDFNTVDINRNVLLKSVSSFCESIKNRGKLSMIDDDFKFIFKHVYSDKLMGDSVELKYWYLGYPNIDENYSDIKVELHFRNKILVGNFYLEKKSEWKITDVQLEKQEKGIFDPTSPAYPM